MFRKNSFFTPEVHEIEYQERVREHALRLDRERPKDDNVDEQVDRKIRDALDDRDMGE